MKTILTTIAVGLSMWSCQPIFKNKHTLDLSDKQIVLYYYHNGIFYLEGKSGVPLGEALSLFKERYPNVEILNNLYLYQNKKIQGYHLLCKTPIPQSTIFK